MLAGSWAFRQAGEWAADRQVGRWADWLTERQIYSHVISTIQNVA